MIKSYSNETETQQVCSCQVCKQLLELAPTGKLEIWYGTGANGKTTLFWALADKVHLDNVVTISVRNSLEDVEYLLKEKVTDNTKLVCIPEVWEDDKGAFANILKKYIKPNTRYILQTNHIYPWMEQDRICRITSFPHRFKRLDSSRYLYYECEKYSPSVIEGGKAIPF